MTEPEQWERDLERLGRSVRPVGPVSDGVSSAVRRRVRTRRRRAGATGVVGAAAVVGAVVVSTALAPGGGSTVRDPVPLADPTAPPSSFSCPTGLGQPPDPPPIPDLERQQEIADELMRSTRSLSAYGVVHAEPTHLGVVALVVGSVDLARANLSDAALVRAYDGSAADAGIAGPSQVLQVVEDELGSVADEVRRATDAVPGVNSVSLWHEAGAVVLQWKRPVPPEVERLAGERENGVEVLVRATTYSARDLQVAGRKLQGFLAREGLDAESATPYGCVDGSGLVVVVEPPLDDRDGLAEQVRDAIGVPVMVAPEEG